MKFFRIINTGLIVLTAAIFHLSGPNGYADDGGQNPAQKATTEASAGGGSGTITPDLFTGTMSYSIPIDVPPGRNGMAPDINLLYRSGNGNGWIGVGWELEMGSIVRSLKNGVDYSGDDYQLRIAGASLDLVYIGDDGYGNREYRAKIEGAFYRIKKMMTGYWEVTDKKGTKYLYGQGTSSRQDDPADANRIFKWCLDRVEDTDGNYMTVSYFKDQGQIYLSRIDYAGNGTMATTHSVEFVLDPYPRNDVADMYTTSFSVKTRYRLAAIYVLANGEAIRIYGLSSVPSLLGVYPSFTEYSHATDRTLLTYVTQYGSDGTTILPTTTFSYYDYDLNSIYSNNQSITDSNGMSGQSWSAEYRQLTTGDFNGDGKMDLILQGTNSDRNTLLLTGNGNGGFNSPQIITTLYGMSLSLWSTEYRRLIPGDFNGDGKTDILLQGLTVTDNTYILIANGSGGFNDKQDITTLYGMSLSLWSAEYRRLVPGDFNGDGKTDILLQGLTETEPTLLLTANGNGGFNDKENITGSNGISGHDWSSAYRRIATGDFNGDGKTDILLQGVNDGRNTLLLLASGQGSFNRQDITTLYGMSLDAWAGNQRYLATGDFNGDGKTDILLQGAIESANTLILRADGSGGFSNVQTITTSYGMSGSSWSAEYRRLATGDFNGDGKTDILLQGVNDGRNTLLLLASGQGSFNRQDITTLYGMSLDAWAGNQRYLVTGDFNGDGKTDVLLQGSATSSNTLILIANTTPQNLLSMIENGLGGDTSIAYTSSTSYSNIQLPFPVQALSSITTDDGNGNTSTTAYTYSGGYYHIQERDFRGFNYVKVAYPTKWYQDVPVQAVTETWFHQGNDTDVNMNNPNVETGYMKGKPYKTQVTAPVRTWVYNPFTRQWSQVIQMKQYSEAKTSYQTNNLSGYSNSHFHPPYQIDASVCDGDACGKQTKTVYTYDSYGNVTREDQYGDTSDSTDDRTVTRSFSLNTTNWIIGLPSNETVYQGIGTTTRVASTDYYYDGVTDCDTASTNQTPTKGKLTRIVRWNPGPMPEARMAYNGYGNLICSRDANGNTTTVSYDSSYTFPTIVTNPLGHQTTTRYNGVDVSWGESLYGLVDRITDSNGAITSFEYDIFGRKTKIYQPDGSWASWSYSSFGTVGSQNIGTSNSAGLSSSSYFDGLGRTIKEKGTGPDGKVIVSETQYDNRGYVYKRSLPYFEGIETAKYNTYTYDAVGRVTRVDVPDGTRTLGCYNDWVTASIDANNHKKRETRDAYGRLVKVEEYTGTFTTCDTGAGTPYSTTTYQYDVLGNLRFVTDGSGNQTEMRYDPLSRKTYMHDPDMGNWRYFYDNNGDLTSQVDAMGQYIYFQYDSLNRLRQKDYSTQKPLGSGDNVYRYDETHTSYGKGRLTSMTDQSGSATYYYNSMGQNTSTDKAVNGSTTYTTQFSYDGMGRLNSIGYPDNTYVNYTYNGPLLSTISNSYESPNITYAAYAGYNALGQPATVTYGNGATTSYTYNSNNYRLNAIGTASGGNTYQSMGYSYDNAGNVTQINDTINGNQSFGYDELNRLTSVLSTVYGSVTYAYDKIGNMTTNSQVGSYTYPTSGTGSVRPHAVTTAGSNSYSYDNNGNMTASAGRTITYDPENRPMTIIANGNMTSFTYDGNGERIRKMAGGATTVYIGKLYECTNGVCEKYIFANGQRIARKTAGSNQVFYYHTDHLGSSSVITDQNGNQMESLAYYPYGQTRTNTGSVNMRHKYTGQELDSETGFYNYNARLYDPVLGKFITADSIVPDPGDPQSFNRYSYVYNNPINYTDPSGHWRIKIGGTEIKGDNETTIAAAIVIATGGAALAYGGPVLYGALVGELVGGYNADKAGGSVLQGVFIGGVTGAITGAMFSAANTMTAAANPLIQIGAKGFVGGTISSITGGSFEKGFMYAAAAATLYWGYTYMAGTEPTMAPGENNLRDGRYIPNEHGQAPGGSNVVGLNDGQGGLLSQGGPVSNVANHIPGINATAGLHDYWMNNMEFDQIRNIGTMVPAAVMSYGAQLGGQLAPLTVQQAVKDSR